MPSDYLPGPTDLKVEPTNVLAHPADRGRILC
jgi:hypothetical protein